MLALASIVKQWIEDPDISVRIAGVVQALGKPYTVPMQSAQPGQQNMMQQHCAMDALATLFALLEEGLQYFPEVHIVFPVVS